ncbi:LTA synthase family protein [Ligilactobacillus acidipiscis]|uniref:Lipoteichoic acid synthase LtaS Type IIb n=1 Tax=Ligilactobacillus acidipiscis TaxID=89059 RepID=A0A0R2JT28_9LACO|nr:LTA synthase family protein [Ligilactobacillus acidipiscis]KRN78533.1 sulfatase family protein [Ligilactobacillus acidipiscis]GAW63185.1 alkaline phosphatase [Ligilactobacillus acidipiscis]GEN21930.1 alkaline phosphatase [Ligilactobacillus acidipiscis]SFV40311.1 Lipoteichoic acid synthase LtaS Type IIb [Ligilactobacillus acidipiscis]
MNLKKIREFINTRIGFLSLLVVLFWIKTILVYLIDFHLGVKGIYQYFVMLINPFATTLLLFSIGLYVKRTLPSYITMFLIYVANTALLLFSVIYYREFTDFMTINVIFGYSAVSQGLSGSSFALLKPEDVIILGDVVLVLLGLLTKLIKLDKRPIKKKSAAAISSFAIFALMFNIVLGEIDRPQLLTRTFDRNYLVKYLGIDTFTVYDGLKTAKNNQARSRADGADLNNILQYTSNHYAKPDPKLFGAGKGKNIIVIHLESFQQFLINYKLDGKEVTPFLNSLYNSKDMYSFENFFNQVGQGKTSDAENMLETGTFGLPQGSLFSALGTDNTFEGAPAILNQEGGYSSAVFHGNNGSFWNRNSVYPNLGYQNFFDASYFNQDSNNLSEYGLKDKLLFHDSVKYLERLQQPFYAKFITVSNHFPYNLDKENTDFPTADTSDNSINNYFVTAHYLDQAVEEFFDYLKSSGLYDNSVIMLYGDHYGISDTRNVKLAKLLGKSSSTWSDYDNTQLQRVPFMLHIPGEHDGGVQKQYGGEIDVLPTLLHLAGIDSSKYIQFGTDLFSPEHDQTVAFRNDNFVTPNYTVIGNTIYQNGTGDVVTHPSADVKKELQEKSRQVTHELSLSDSLNNKNLLRFYVPNGFTPVNPKEYDYQNDFYKLIQTEKKLQQRSTSLWSRNQDHSTIDDYDSDAPELKKTDDNSANVSSAKKKITTNKNKDVKNAKDSSSVKSSASEVNASE